MLEKSLETLFRRYRSRGDAKALGQVFDRTARELLAVAAHLGHGPAEAEDVVQETFLAALSAAKRWDDRRPLMPWLVGILTREARYHRRRAARSIEPDRLSPRVAATPTDAAEREELANAIAEALRKVPPTYRDVLVGHLADGLAPRELAERLGRAPGTVRVQLHRGLEHLRRALPPSFALGVAAATLPGRGLAAVRAEILASAPATATASTVTLPARALLALTAASGVLGLAWMRLGGGAGLDEAPPLDLRLAGEVQADLRLGAGGEDVRLAPIPRRDLSPPPEQDFVALRASRSAREIPDPPPGEEIGPPDDAVRWTVEGRLLVRGPFDASRATISLTGDGRPLGTTTADDRGNFELEFTAQMAGSPEPEAFVLRADHPDFAVSLEQLAPRDFGRGPHYREVQSLRLRVPAGFVEGDVDTHGGEARVGLLPLTKGALVLSPSADEVSTAGRFRLRIPEPGSYVVVAVQPDHPPAWEVVSLDKRSADTVLCDRLRIPEGSTLVGDLKLPPGVSADGAQVVSRPAEVERVLELRGEATYVGCEQETVETLPWNGLLWNSRRFLRDLRTCAVDQDGRFELRGLAEDEHVLVVRELPGFEEEILARTQTWLPGPPLTLIPEISLLRVQVTKDGEPAPNVPVDASDASRRSTSGTTDAAGEVELVVRAARPMRLVSSSAAGHAQHFAHSAVASRWVRVSLELGDAALVPGIVVGAAAPTDGDPAAPKPPPGSIGPPKNGLVLFLEGEGPELLNVRWRPSGGGAWKETVVVPETLEVGAEEQLTVYMLADTGPVDDVTATSDERSWRAEVVMIEADCRVFRLIEN